MRVDYEDEDSNNLVIHAETSKGEHVINLSEEKFF